MLWLEYTHLYIVLERGVPTTILNIVADDAFVRSCRRYIPPDLWLSFGGLCTKYNHIQAAPFRQICYVLSEIYEGFS